jgi:hypothetical protein
MLDVETCAVAFRILRMNGYNVSSGKSCCSKFQPCQPYLGHKYLTIFFILTINNNFQNI